MITLDGKKLQEFGLEVLENHDHPLLPNTRDNFLEIPGMDGVHDMGSNREPIYLNIPLGIGPQKSYADLRYITNQFKRFILDPYGKPRLMKVIYEYDSNKYYMARYSGSLPIERLIDMGRFNLPLIAPKGHSESIVESHEIHWDSEEVTMDHDYSLETVAVEDVTITSNQTLEAYVNGFAIRPKIIINGTGDNVTFQANGKSFSLKNFTNSLIEVDGETFNVYKDSVVSYSTKVGKDFLELLPGMNQITITGTNMNFNLSIRVRDQY